MTAAAHSPSTRDGTGVAESRERNARLIAATVFAVCAAVTLRAAQNMRGGMPMPGGWEMSMMWMPGRTFAGAAWMFLTVWQAMMIAMMLPSSWPMLELYRRVAISSGERRPGVATVAAGAGYFAVWLAFGAVVFAGGFGISAGAMHSAPVSRAMPLVAGAALILAGVFQLTPWKQACLRHCRSPLLFLGHAWRPGMRGAVRVGIIHGAYCAGCCWALMLIQSVLGVMSIGVMTAVAAVIGVEKLWRRGPILARAAGVVAIGVGVWVVVGGVR
jgi:predicted metal-binding membrane protein